MNKIDKYITKLNVEFKTNQQPKFEEDPKIWFCPPARLIFVRREIESVELYSYTRDVWKAHPTLCQHEFPFMAVTKYLFHLEGGWDFEAGSLQYIKADADWKSVNSDGSVTSKYVSSMTLGTLKNKHITRYQKGNI